MTHDDQGGRSRVMPCGVQRESGGIGYIRDTDSAIIEGRSLNELSRHIDYSSYSKDFPPPDAIKWWGHSVWDRSPLPVRVSMSTQFAMMAGEVLARFCNCK